MVNLRPLGASTLTPIVKNLLIINGLCYLACFFILNKFNVDLNDKVGLYFPASASFRPFQFITHFFFHSFVQNGHIYFFHILSNMFALWLFGSSLENYWGSKRFLSYYLITGLGAALILTLVNYFKYVSLTEHISTEQLELVKEEGRSILLQGANYTDPLLAKLNLFLNTPTVGASGAVFGVLLAFGMLFPNTELLIYFAFPVKAKYLVIGYGLMELYRGIIDDPSDNVAHFAHLGGMLFGYILIKYWNKTRRNSLY
jgi:membrane associated rhomboid family serine protease